MMVPDFQTLMRPVLAASAQGEISISDVVTQLEREFNLTDEDSNAMLPSGKQTRFANRVHWARSYLKQAGLIQNPRRGYLKISDDGAKVLESGDEIDSKYLGQFSSFQEFMSRTGKNADNSSVEEEQQKETPDELLRHGFLQINRALAAELLSRLREGDPAFFEKTIVNLLLKMGYGASVTAGQTIGGSGDDGVDGVINQDPLGVDQVYIQAKRYKSGNNIGSGAIRDFFGALSLKDVSKGIFVTTSAFSSSATETAAKLGARIVLIDGVKLAELMIQHEIGCRVEEIYRISRLDDGFFE